MSAAVNVIKQYIRLASSHTWKQYAGNRYTGTLVACHTFPLAMDIKMSALKDAVEDVCASQLTLI